MKRNEAEKHQGCGKVLRMLSENPRAPHDTRNEASLTPWAAAEEALRLRRGGDLLSHDTRNAYNRARDAKETGALCGRCGRAIAPDEPIWRTRERIARGQTLSTNVCRECAPEHTRKPEDTFYEGEWFTIYAPEPCEVCGRPVVWLHYPDWRLLRCCSSRCDHRRYNRARDEAAAAARRKVCEVCGSEFVATRADAKTCSPKCRQAAYRRRHS